MGSPGHRIIEVRRRAGSDRVILFIHGFSGDQGDTWGLIPTLLGTDTALNAWDIVSLGYATSLLPDIRGIWSADPDLPILALHLNTRFDIAPLAQYRSFAIVAHSMGGLVVQRALLDNPDLVRRVKELIFFGTPSGGLGQAGIFSFLKPQLRNMDAKGEFVSRLRREWTERFDDTPPFKLLAVAGDRDQFVPPRSSLDPFEARFRRVVAGDHLTMIKAKEASAESVQLLVAALSAKPEPAAASAPLRTRVMGMSEPEVEHALATPERRLTQAEVVNAAIMLDLDDKRQQAIALLEQNLALGTDIKGTLGGRFKRLWLETADRSYAERALELYRSALDMSSAADDHEQVYYHAINVAFLSFVVWDRKTEAEDLARLALEHCAKAPETLWRVATEAEARLYLNETEVALADYERAFAMGAEHWQLQSAGQQAYQIAVKLGAPELQEKLQTLFNPESRHLNRIFVSYSHRDRDWLERLRKMINPYVRNGELDFWDDTRLKAGDRWFGKIGDALASCRVAVLLVSDEFLASDFINQKELPVILAAAERQAIRLVWVYLSPALYEETPIRSYQAAHVPLVPLDSLSKSEQNEALKQIALNIKAAVFDNQGDRPGTVASVQTFPAGKQTGTQARP
jgi:pimeloyl-ACP methyl ester carboxylesterase